MPQVLAGNTRTGEKKSELVSRSQLLLQYLLAFDHLLETSEAGGGEDREWRSGVPLDAVLRSRAASPALESIPVEALPAEGFTD
jgi:hypothetical protein